MGGSSWGLPVIHEPFTGAWQRNQELRPDTMASFHALYACVTLIASDVSKVGIDLVQQGTDGLWTKVTTTEPFSKVIRRPNRYQNRIKFIEQWVVSKLSNGNTYILKERDGRGIVTSLYILDPCRTRAMVAEDGSVWYQTGRDSLNGINEDNVMIPASEIIHDVMVPLYHPLCGVSPITACSLAVTNGLQIQRDSTRFFANGSRPSGILTAPTLIPQKDADELKERWEQNYGAANTGRVAVLGSGLTYQPMSVSAHDAQLIEQLKWSAETVCSCFHVPSYMIGIGAPPNYNNIEALNQQYYTQCLQKLIEDIELLLDEGLYLTDVGGGKTYGTSFDLDDLIRMDTKTKIEAAVAGRQGGIYTHNEARRKFDLRAVEGGDVPFGQQQDFPISVLANRSGPDVPIGPASSVPPATEPDEEKGVRIDGRFLSLALLERQMTRESVHARNTGP